jgi:dihydroxy-acid dehydratase
LIRIDIPARKLELVGCHGNRMSPEELDHVLAERRVAWTPPERVHPRGLLRRYSKYAVSAMKGAFLEG